MGGFSTHLFFLVNSPWGEIMGGLHKTLGLCHSVLCVMCHLFKFSFI